MKEDRQTFYGVFCITFQWFSVCVHEYVSKAFILILIVVNYTFSIFILFPFLIDLSFFLNAGNLFNQLKPMPIKFSRERIIF